jgi:hypothetical protein
MPALPTKPRGFPRNNQTTFYLPFPASCLSWVPEQGTVGASGDLAPLSHLALGLMGEGQMWSPETGWGDAKYVSITLTTLTGNFLLQQCSSLYQILLPFIYLNIHLTIKSCSILVNILSSNFLVRKFKSSFG